MVTITKEGKISIAIYDNNWCAQKSEDGSSVVLSKYEPDKCTLDSIPDVTPDNPLTPDKGQTVESFMTDENAGENGSIRLDNNGNKRYAGSDPNNYVCFGMSGETCDDNHYIVL